MALSSTLSRFFQIRHFRSYFYGLKSFIVYQNWLQSFLIQFVFNINVPSRPISQEGAITVVRSPSFKRWTKVHYWNHGDLMTIHEIFCWECYGLRIKNGDAVLDLGGNIGLSASYFLSQLHQSSTYIVEPNASLLGCINTNLSQFDASRYQIDICAVGSENNIGTFIENESHSRYSTVTVALPQNKANIHILSLSNLMHKCLDKFGRLDVLKIDIEGSGFHVLDSLEDDFNILPRVIFIEEEFNSELSLRWLNFHYNMTRHYSGIYVYLRKK